MKTIKCEVCGDDLTDDYPEDLGEIGFCPVCMRFLCRDCAQWENAGTQAVCQFCAEKEARTTCDKCGKKLYEGDDYWGNNQIGTFCEDCADDEIASWWGTIY